MASHFAARCRERGITKTNPFTLQSEIKQAFQDGRDDMIEPVKQSGTGGWIYRFRVPEGIFYAVLAECGTAKTVLTKEMVRKKKWAVKKQKRGHKRGE